MPGSLGSQPFTCQLILSAFAEQLKTATPSAETFTDIGIWSKSASFNKKRNCIKKKIKLYAKLTTRGI